MALREPSDSPAFRESNVVEEELSSDVDKSDAAVPASAPDAAGLLLPENKPDKPEVPKRPVSVEAIDPPVAKSLARLLLPPAAIAFDAAAVAVATAAAGLAVVVPEAASVGVMLGKPDVVIARFVPSPAAIAAGMEANIGGRDEDSTLMSTSGETPAGELSRTASRRPIRPGSRPSTPSMLVSALEKKASADPAMLVNQE